MKSLVALRFGWELDTNVELCTVLCAVTGAVDSTFRIKFTAESRPLQ